MDYWDEPSRSWADTMSDNEADCGVYPPTKSAKTFEHEQPPSDDEDLCDHLLRYFPVPGEICTGPTRPGRSLSGDGCTSAVAATI
jgi:hypothetical protein